MKKYRKYRQFELFIARCLGKSCRALHLTSPAIPSFKIDLDNNPVMTSKSNSWVRNMINIMACQGLLGASLNGSKSFFDDGYLNARNLAGTIENSLNGYTAAIVSAGDAYSEKAYLWGAGSDYGIQVGSLDTAESFNDYKLAGQIAHGNSSGQLYRNAQNTVSKSWDSVNRKWVQTLQRSFVNNSGAAITVKEIAFYVLYIPFSGYNGSSVVASGLNSGYMIIRDVLPSPVTVNNGQTLTVTYTIEYSF